MTACLRCNREARQWVATPGVEYVACFCGDKCRERGEMVDPTEAEIKGMEAGAAAGGEYLDSLGKTDLAMLTPDEYMTFIECVCTGFVESVQAA